MTAIYYKDVPSYRLDLFKAVRQAGDNLSNLLALAEIVNTCHDISSTTRPDDFDIAIFSGNYTRAWIRRGNGYFSMAIPFQVITEGEFISFNIDNLSEPVSGELISIFRNAIQTCATSSFCHEDIALGINDSFGIEVPMCLKYADAFAELLTEDHGYFRYDHDPDNENGEFHPLHHLDFFFKNTSAVKIGLSSKVGLDLLHSLCDSSVAKRYIR
ncbi:MULTISPECIES: hypothetical protein [Stenotrophomonas]|uniref:hypothetical protein n=1 Tax=Stenotrophomonas TaxID=40323 RepID=UPI0018D3123B|nr:MULTISPECIES: hypothetical protein [Stenotrophomonas]MBH1852446.1 hypothetical protein [Stenotrophomonas maltophilia]